MWFKVWNIKFVRYSTRSISSEIFSLEHNELSISWKNLSENIHVTGGMILFMGGLNIYIYIALWNKPYKHFIIHRVVNIQQLEIIVKCVPLAIMETLQMARQTTAWFAHALCRSTAISRLEIRSKNIYIHLFLSHIPSFATGCEISEDGYRVHCTCREGYTGEKCQACARGYFGQPTIEGQFCQPCQCSGNIDPEEDGSCDSVSGECLKCRNNTSGSACDYCAPFYFGDAVHLKDCQSKSI